MSWTLQNIRATVGRTLGKDLIYSVVIDSKLNTIIINVTNCTIEYNSLESLAQTFDTKNIKYRHELPKGASDWDGSSYGECCQIEISGLQIERC